MPASSTPVDRAQPKPHICGKINPPPSDRRSTVPLSCTVEGREGRVEEWKGAGGDHRPVRGAGQLSGGGGASGLRSQDGEALCRAGRRVGPVGAAAAAGA